MLCTRHPAAPWMLNTSPEPRDDRPKATVRAARWENRLFWGSSRDRRIRKCKYFDVNGSYHHNAGVYDQNKHAYANLRHILGLGQHVRLLWGLTQPPKQRQTLNYGNNAIFVGAPNRRKMGRHSAGMARSRPDRNRMANGQRRSSS